MAGYVIHIAVAQEYLRKNKIEYNKEFIRGSILPDLTDDKSKTHYGKSPAYTSLKGFLTNNNIYSWQKKGEFLHLITDYLFYNHYLENFCKPEIYNDYDILNKKLIEKYKVKLLTEIEQDVYFKEGPTKVFDFNLACKIIDEISDLDISTVKKEVLQGISKWEYYKNLV